MGPTTDIGKGAGTETAAIEEEKQFIEKSQKLYRDIYQKRLTDEETIRRIVLVKKGDSIKLKVNRVMETINQQNIPILLVAKANAIGKLITITEISKSRLSESNPPIKLDQYNKIGKQVSKNKPYSSANRSLSGHNSKSVAQKNKRTLLNDLRIEDEKTFKLPLLYIVLTSNDSHLSVENWTHQAPI
ncbi:Piso0_000032 [Millerozyma farinosa CBS 7064]|uniref:Piso0_000032 protein n=1 Tax=Pichia sorbitophila (strain ATCC MYA-4447 / BCRC 22081 / CBS 7064 / NBRC 10061 / NRRL Y-12695) TaxID=559304 RepID=G8YSX1_PICSO|nr:Piso0_000032 [Millerozyma farinosa CBS 7064]